MNFLIFFTVLVTIFAFLLNKTAKAYRLSIHKKSRFSSLPIHYTYCFILWCIIFASAILLTSFDNILKIFLLIFFAALLFFVSKSAFKNRFDAKNHIEKAGTILLSLTAAIGIIITLAITISILFESIKFFELVKPQDFFFSTKWNPQMAIHEEQGVSQSSFGIIPVFLGTILITVIAMCVSIPTGIMAAIYLSFYAKAKTRDYLKPILEILAGIPTVVYGYFAVIAVSPFFKNLFGFFGSEIPAESALAAGITMGIMIIPFVLSLTDDALNSVPRYLKDGGLALGSTKSEMISKVVIPSAMPSIVGAIILAVSRAIGETMIVVMAAGLIAKMTFNPLDSVTTATAQIVTLLVGDQEFDSPKTLAAFALALTLFALTFIFNVIALIVIKKYKKNA